MWASIWYDRRAWHSPQTTVMSPTLCSLMSRKSTPKALRKGPEDCRSCRARLARWASFRAESRPGRGPRRPPQMCPVTSVAQEDFHLEEPQAPPHPPHTCPATSVVQEDFPPAEPQLSSAGPKTFRTASSMDCPAAAAIATGPRGPPEHCVVTSLDLKAKYISTHELRRIAQTWLL
jgi:hypothetical protein